MRTRYTSVIVGSALIASGMIVAVVYFLQPWRSCDYEDTSAGCSMLPTDAAVMMAGWLALLVGVITLVSGLIRLRGRRTASSDVLRGR